MRRIPLKDIALPLALGVALLAVDLLVPLGFAVPVLYVVPVVVTLRTRNPWHPVLAAGVATALIVAAIWLKPPGGSVPLGLANRGIAIALVWIAALCSRRYRLAERALEERTNLARDYLDIAEVILIALDSKGRVDAINRKGCAVLGYPEQALVGRDWVDTCVPAGERDRITAVHAQLMEGVVAPNAYVENTVVTASGEERLIGWRNALLRGTDGSIRGTVSSGEDISDRARTERALRHSLKELADLKFALDASAIVAATDPRGIIKYVNDKFCEISKFSREELIGRDHRIINSGHHPKEFMRDLWGTITSGRVWTGEIKNRAKDGSYYWVDTTIVPFLDETGRPTQFTAIRFDITRRKLAEERSREQAALARLGEMAAVVAHEVKNPLAGVRGVLQVIRKRLPADSSELTVTGEAMRRLDTLDQMIQDLLLFARPRPPRFGQVGMRALLQETVDLLAADPAARDVQVKISGVDAELTGDQELLKALFLNLLLNAAQAMGGTGQIALSIDASNGACRVAVQDRGPGIAPQHRERIFEPFFTTKHRGTGLGLAVARRTVDLHQGEISVECPPEGGTTVLVSLPLKPDEGLSRAR